MIPSKPGCPLDMYPHQLPLHSFPSPVLSLQLGAQHPCLLGSPHLAPSPCPRPRLRLSLPVRPSSMCSPKPSLRSSSMCSPRPRLIPSLCLRLTPNLEDPQPHLQPLSFPQSLPSLLLWLPSSALEPQVDPGHSPVRSWGPLNLRLPVAQAPLSPPASPMLSRRKSPECRRNSIRCPHRLKTKIRDAPLGPQDL